MFWTSAFGAEARYSSAPRSEGSPEKHIMASGSLSPPASLAAFLGSMKQALPGLAIAGAVGLAGWLIAAWTQWPGIVIALLIGVALHPLARGPAFQPGFIMAVKKLLRVAIAFLGVRVALGDFAALGLPVAALVVVTMAITLASGIVLARLIGRTAAYGALAGGATAVCGASAALALATVLPRDKQGDTDAVYVVLTVNALSTVAMVAYPWLSHAIGLDFRATGILLGATIHDVAQVVGAGNAVSELTANVATIVKLLRVFLLLPVVLIVGIGFSGSGADAGKARVPVPGFAIMFVVFATLNSFHIFPEAVRSLLLNLSQAGLFLAIAALGLQTSLAAMIKLGWRPMAVVVGSTLVLLGAALVGLRLIGAA